MIIDLTPPSEGTIKLNPVSPIEVRIAPAGPRGVPGWSPVVSVFADGPRRVQRVTDWVGGSGIKPAVGLYVGSAGLVADVADAADIRGATGPVGPGGATGATGAMGAAGDDGWSPVLANVVDGNRRVQQVTDWVGGSGIKPAVGLYVGSAGLVADVADATDMRGSPGALPPGFSAGASTAFVYYMRG